MENIAVVGDMTIDIIIKDVIDSVALCRKSSISVRAGGVGRNIALNLKLLGCAPTLITACDFSGAGVILEQDIITNKLNVYRLQSERNNYFCGQIDASGTVMTGYFDAEAMERVAACEYISALEKTHPQSVIVDANLLEDQAAEIISWCQNRNLPYALEAVCAPKALRLRSMLSGCSLVKLNLAELRAITQREIATEEDIISGVRVLTEAGAKSVLLSLGAKGCLLTTDRINYNRSLPTLVVNENGAGDAMFAAYWTAITRGIHEQRALDIALKAARMTCEVEQTVNTRITWEALCQKE